MAEPDMDKEKPLTAPPTPAAPPLVETSEEDPWYKVVPGWGWRRCGDDIVYFSNHYSKVKRSNINAPGPPKDCSMEEDPEVESEIAGVAGPHAWTGAAAGATALVYARVLSNQSEEEGKSEDGAMEGGEGRQSGPTFEVFRPEATAAAMGLGSAGRQGGAAAGSGSNGGGSSSSGPCLRENVVNSGAWGDATGGLYTETWSLVFPPGTHAAYFAYCYPYTYSDLRWDMRRWVARASRSGRGQEVQLSEPWKAAWAEEGPPQEVPGPGAEAEEETKEEGSGLRQQLPQGQEAMRAKVGVVLSSMEEALARAKAATSCVQAVADAEGGGAEEGTSRGRESAGGLAGMEGNDTEAGGRHDVDAEPSHKPPSLRLPPATPRVGLPSPEKPLLESLSPSHSRAPAAVAQQRNIR